MAVPSGTPELSISPSDAVYVTTFPANENPISESGNWAHTAGNGMCVVRTSGGNALGTQTDNTLDDSYTILQGDWGTDYEIEAVIYRHASLPEAADPSHETEMLFRASDGADAYQAYEIMVNSVGLINCGHWTAPLTVDVIVEESGPGYDQEVLDGDVVRARIVGNTISVWVNDASCCTYDITDHSPVFNTGNPGIGFFTRPSVGGNTDYFGFKSVTVTKL